MKKEDFSSMKYDPFVEDIFGKYPELRTMDSWKDFKMHNTHDKVLRFIIVMYSKDSPILKIPDYSDRVSVTLKLLHVMSGHLVYDILLNLTGTKDFDVLLMIHDYLSFQNNKLFSLIVINEHSFNVLQKEMLDRTEASDDNKMMDVLIKKNKMMKEMDEISKRLDTYYAEFFMDNEEVRAKIDRMDFSSPESIARYLRKLKG